MKHGDIIIKEVWWKKYITFRFRFDPIPHTGYRLRNYFPSWYKTPKHMNEKRQFFACEDQSLVRKKRTPWNLPDPWDDYKRSDRYLDKSWKKNHKVRKQWGKHI